jgi:hypothetical protein
MEGQSHKTNGIYTQTSTAVLIHFGHYIVIGPEHGLIYLKFRIGMNNIKVFPFTPQNYEIKKESEIFCTFV